MEKLKEIEVWFSNKAKIGTIKSNNQRPYTTIFKYSDEWLKTGFPISPFSLPLEDKEFIANPFLFDGVYGVFADSLPDGWGRLLVDRMLKNNGINPFEVDSLNRLAIVGDSGMGALTYNQIDKCNTKEEFLNLKQGFLLENAEQLALENKQSNVPEMPKLSINDIGTRIETLYLGLPNKHNIDEKKLSLLEKYLAKIEKLLAE